MPTPGLPLIVAVKSTEVPCVIGPTGLDVTDVVVVWLAEFTWITSVPWLPAKPGPPL